MAVEHCSHENMMHNCKLSSNIQIILIILNEVVLFLKGGAALLLLLFTVYIANLHILDGGILLKASGATRIRMMIIVLIAENGGKVMTAYALRYLETTS